MRPCPLVLCRCPHPKLKNGFPNSIPDMAHWSEHAATDRKIPESKVPMHDPSPPSIAAPRSRFASTVAPWWHAGLLILLLVGVSALSTRQAHRQGMSAHHAERYLVGMAFEWVMLLLVWWGLRMRRVSLAEIIGFRRGPRAFAEDLAAAAIFWIMAMIVLAAIGILLKLLHFSSPQRTLAALAPGTPLEMLLWIALSLSAGFCEETLFRGYFFRQFASAGHRIWIGVVISSLLFGIGHGYEGAAGMIAIAAFGALFCALALARNSLRPGMIAHAWHDIFTGVALALLHRTHHL